MLPASGGNPTYLFAVGRQAENIHPKYIGGFSGIKGLPVKYYIQSEDGLLCYTLQGIKEKEIPNSFFSVGKEYEKISFNDFIERISK